MDLVAPPPLWLPSRPAIIRAHEGELDALRTLEHERGIKAMLPGMVPTIGGSKAELTFVGESSVTGSGTTLTPHADTRPGDLGVILEAKSGGSDVGVPSGWTSLSYASANLGGANRYASIMARLFDGSSYNTATRTRSNGSTGSGENGWLLTFRYPGRSGFSAGSAGASTAGSGTSNFTLSVGGESPPILCIAVGSNNGSVPGTLSNSQGWDDGGIVDGRVAFKRYNPGDTPVDNTCQIICSSIRMNAWCFIRLT